MKKILAMVLVLVMMCCLAACGNTNDRQNNETEKTTETKAPETQSPITEDVTPEEPETTESVAQEVVTEEPVTEEPVTKVTEDTYTWREFLKDYEAWVDDYIAFMNKYNANPADLTLLADYATMMSEYAEWADKVDKMDDNLSDTEALEYAAELSRIATKLTTVAY